MNQVAKSFDKETIIKIIKGGLIAGTGAFAIAVLNYIGALNINDPNLAMLVTFGVPFLTNIVKEWLKGE
ncbi:MAG: hypothetical protein WC108_05430 [Bacteroidales bacterium]